MLKTGNFLPQLCSQKSFSVLGYIFYIFLSFITFFWFLGQESSAVSWQNPYAPRLVSSFQKLTGKKTATLFAIEEISKINELIKRLKSMHRRHRVGAFALPSAAHKICFWVCVPGSPNQQRSSFKNCCDNGRCSQVGNDGFCGFRSGHPFSFYRDQCQIVPRPASGTSGASWTSLGASVGPSMRTSMGT